jgi:hypothetical protein
MQFNRDTKKPGRERRKTSKSCCSLLIRRVIGRKKKMASLLNKLATRGKVLEKLLAVNASVTGRVDASRQTAQQSVQEGQLGFNGHDLVCATAYGCCIDSGRLAKTGDKERLCVIGLGRAHGTTSHRETLICTARQNQSSCGSRENNLAHKTSNKHLN